MVQNVQCSSLEFCWNSEPLVSDFMADKSITLVLWNSVHYPNIMYKSIYERFQAHVSIQICWNEFYQLFNKSLLNGFVFHFLNWVLIFWICQCSMDSFLIFWISKFELKLMQFVVRIRVGQTGLGTSFAKLRMFSRSVVLLQWFPLRSGLFEHWIRLYNNVY